MPLTTIQSRIDAFEALSSASAAARKPHRAASPPPPASLIDLQDWVVDDGVGVPPLLPRRPSVSHTYPPLGTRPARHAPAESISSFHSVSLSSDSFDADDDSFEQVDTPSLVALPSPPKLPQRPPSSPASPSRRPPPPPPDRASDRSSINSTATSSHLKVKRPTPVPPAARLRYDAVFDANVRQHRAAHKQKPPEHARRTHRRAAGWRGLSVDLVTGSHVDVVVSPTDKLEGRFVKPIWRRSRLGRRTLAEIWNECDPDRTGSLTRDQFAKGMWRIDEELRRAHVQALKPTLRSAFKPPPVPKNKPILR